MYIVIFSPCFTKKKFPPLQPAYLAVRSLTVYTFRDQLMLFLYVLFITRVGLFCHNYKTRREAECFICDKTRLTSVSNDFKNVSVRFPHSRSICENWQRLN